VGQVGDDQGFHGKSPWKSVWLVEAFICARWTISRMRARCSPKSAKLMQVIEKKGFILPLLSRDGGWKGKRDDVR
jgi:hypothetical protein